MKDEELDMLIANAEYEPQQLKDYITNLQEENRDLSRMCELYSKSLYNAELTDYKSRNGKAIEYCNKEIGNIIANFDYVDTTDLENVRKILQGEDKDD